jgi:3-mercaptopropionate dioxygenase
VCDFENAAHPDVMSLVTSAGRAALLNLHEATTQVAAAGGAPGELIARLRAPFEDFLRSDGWLPEACKVPIPGKAASYVLLRSKEPEFVLFSMVLPAHESTKIHNHLAWGLIGLAQGRQHEVQYRRIDDGRKPDYAALAQSDVRDLELGEITRLLPPADDIHIITTLSDTPSISIHILGNDLGSVPRQLFYPEEHRAETFVSGYDNIGGIAGADASGVGARR